MSYRSTRGTPGEGKPFDTEVRFRRILAALCAVVVVVLAIGGGIYLSARRAQATSAAKEQLIAIADLKLRQIISWRAERLADAHFFSLARFAAQDVQRFLDNPGLAANRSAILHWLNLLKGDRYYAAMIIDPRMRCRLSIPDNVTEPVVSLQALLAGALKAHEPIMSDLHRDQANGFIHLDIAFPLFKNADPGSGAPIAMVLLKLDSRSFLFPLVRSWPTPSKTGETYLVSRKGDDVLYLSDLRDAPGMALSLRIPLKSPGLVAARVLQGETEPFEGWDFHGVPVVAVGRRVPGTDWAMIARVDRRELYGPLRRQLLAEALVLGGLLIISVLTVGLVWRRRNAQFFQRELSLEKERGTIADRLAHLMQNASDIILISDTEGRVIDANECALKSYGYNLGEIQQLNIKDLCAPDTMPGLKESANGTADDTTIFETIHRRKDGSAFPVEVSSRKISIGGESYRLCIVRDISERRRSEQHVRDLNFALGQRNAELDEERMHWRAALEGIADEVWICDKAGKMSLMNLSAVTQMGLEEFRGRTIDEVLEDIEIMNPDDSTRPWDQAPLLRALESGNIVRGEEIMLHRRTGKRRHRQYSSSPIRDAEGTVTGAVAIIHDITDRKLAEQAVERAKEEWERTFDSVPDLIAIFDDQHRVVRMNRAMAERLGLSTDQCLGRACHEYLHGLAERPDYCPYIRTMQDQKEHTVEVYEERLGGYFLVTTCPLFHEGRMIGAVQVSRDINAVKHAEAELRKINAGLESRVAARTSDLTKTINRLEAETQERAQAEAALSLANQHLRSLTLELTRAEAQERQRLSQVLHDHLQQLIVSAGFNIEFVGDRLTDPELRNAVAGAGEALLEATEECRNLAVELAPPILRGGLTAALPWLAKWMERRHGLSVRLHMDPGAEPEDPDVVVLLFQSMREALFNVVKHAGVREAALIVSRPDSDRLRIEIADQGAGFDSTRQDANSGAAAGPTGLGLFSIRDRLKLLGGQVDILSAPGHGTNIVLTLPLAAKATR